MEEETLREQLDIADTSIGFLLLIIAATLFSFWSVLIQRRGICLSLAGQEEAARFLPPVRPPQCISASLVVGALGFFFCLALDGLAQAEAGDDPCARRTARSNLWASLFVLLAGVLRYQVLASPSGRRSTPAADDTLPD